MSIIDRLKRLPFVVKSLQAKHPSNSTCKICGLPWASCISHDIILSHPHNGVAGKGFFPVCKWCWEHKSYQENQQAVIDTYWMWRNQCDGSYELPHTLSDMLHAFETDWILTHKKI